MIKSALQQIDAINAETESDDRVQRLTAQVDVLQRCQELLESAGVADDLSAVVAAIESQANDSRTQLEARMRVFAAKHVELWNDSHLADEIGRNIDAVLAGGMAVQPLFDLVSLLWCSTDSCGEHVYEPQMFARLCELVGVVLSEMPPFDADAWQEAAPDSDFHKRWEIVRRSLGIIASCPADRREWIENDCLWRGVEHILVYYNSWLKQFAFPWAATPTFMEAALFASVLPLWALHQRVYALTDVELNEKARLAAQAHPLTGARKEQVWKLLHLATQKQATGLHDALLHFVDHQPDAATHLIAHGIGPALVSPSHNTGDKLLLMKRIIAADRSGSLLAHQSVGALFEASRDQAMPDVLETLELCVGQLESPGATPAAIAESLGDNSLGYAVRSFAELALFGKVDAKRDADAAFL